MIKACLFDLDGVIVDTAKYHYLGWKRLAQELGFEFTEENNEALKGVSRMASLDILLSVGNMKDNFTLEQKEEMAARKNAWYVEYISELNEDEILPGVVQFLQELRANGIKTALGSASKNAEIILNGLGIRSLFDEMVDGNMVSEAKPDPQVFLLGAQLVNVSPAESVVFEDAEAGIEAATRAGMRSVGIGLGESLSKASMQIAGFDGFTLAQLKQAID